MTRVSYSTAREIHTAGPSEEWPKKIERGSGIPSCISITGALCVSTERDKFQASLLRMIYTIILGKTNVTEI